jgi:DNA-binding transcriptional LysR family regulator
MIELRLYGYFVTLAETLHFGRAAARHGIAQPPFSQQIQKLERELGTQLVQRSNRKVELTAAGKVFLVEANRTLAAAERAERSAKLAGEGRVGPLSIGIVSSAAYEDIIANILLRLGARYPRIDIVLHEMTTPQQMHALHSGEIQAGFGRPPVHSAEVEAFTVCSEPLLLALPVSHPLAQEKSIALRLLASDPWVMLPSDMGLGFYDQVIRVCHDAGFVPETRQVATQIHTMISLVAAGLGITLIPASVSTLHRAGVVYRPLKGRTEPVKTIALWMPSRMVPLLENLLQIIHEVVRSTKSVKSASGVRPNS